LPLELFTRATPGSDPLAVSDGQGREHHILRANPAATRLGITPGMRVSAALALAGGLQVMPRAAAAEQQALEHLAAWAGQYSSLVHIAAPHTLLLEVGGSLKLFRDLPNLLAQIEFGVAELGYTVPMAVAPTPLAATWLARSAVDAQVTDSAALAGTIARLPLAVLDVGNESLARLTGMGLRDIGDCLRLPRAGLAKRLGPELVLKLDRALGRMSDVRAPFIPPARFESRLELPGTVENVQGLVFALHRLVAELCGELRARAAGVMRIQLKLAHPHAPVTEFVLGLVAPGRDPKHLIELLRERLAQIALPEAVEALVLQADGFLPLGAWPLDLFGARHHTEESAATLIERLRARLGETSVQELEVVAEHRPEHAYTHQRPETAPVLVAGGDRPLWLLPEPLPLDERNNHPWIDGALYLDGDAERIESGWWDENDIGRDYFVARHHGGERYWVFRELRAPRRWWLHGIFG